MPDQIAGFPYWKLVFDENGDQDVTSQAHELTAGVAQERLTDLFIISHGWNNSPAMALELYTRFFGEMRSLIDNPNLKSRTASIGVAGVIWPSMNWPDEPATAADEGGVAGFGRSRRAGQGSAEADPRLFADLRSAYASPDRQKKIDELEQLLRDRPRNSPALARFQEVMRELTTIADDAALEDDVESALLKDEPRDVFLKLSAAAPEERSEGGVASAGNIFNRLWAGARVGLRQLTYLEMKLRAGTVGQGGLGPLIGDLHAAKPELRVHLVGHSFGARLVSFALAGLPDAALAEGGSPVKSVTLVQGAFSHFAFALALPHDKQRGGALAGLVDRVDGPVVVLHSVHDTAVGVLYPRISLLFLDDTAFLANRWYRWGAMGHDGAQEVGAVQLGLGPVGQAYPFQTARFTNLNSNEVIKKMEGISGAHGDIHHPEIAWATLCSAGICEAST